MFFLFILPSQQFGGFFVGNIPSTIKKLLIENLVRSVAKHEVRNICRYDSSTFCLASIIPVLLVIRGGHAHFFYVGNCNSRNMKGDFSKCISATFSRNCTFNISATGFLSAVCNLLKKCCSETAYPHFYNWFWKCGLKKLQNFASAVTRSKHACLRM
jgi:hypothetical protein